MKEIMVSIEQDNEALVSYFDDKSKITAALEQEGVSCQVSSNGVKSISQTEDNEFIKGARILLAGESLSSHIVAAA